MKTYFIQAASGPVKIGKAGILSKRLGALSCGSHEPLSVLGVIEGDEEKRLHRLFAGDRIRGEWFRPSWAVMEFIAENTTRAFCGKAMREELLGRDEYRTMIDSDLMAIAADIEALRKKIRYFEARHDVSYTAPPGLDLSLDPIAVRP